MQEPGTHKLTEALEGQTPPPGDPASASSGPPKPTHDEVAEQTRREQESRSDGTPDREEKLVKIGRGNQTHG